MFTVRNRHRGTEAQRREGSCRAHSPALRLCPVAPLPPSSRRGVALMVVMVAISVSLVLTYSFLKTQTTVMQISRNTARRDLALQAAQTGAAVALSVMQTPEWEGVETQLSRVVHSDLLGTASYVVEFRPPTGDGRQALPDDAALRVLLRSTGTWQSAENDAELVQQHVEVVVKLKPRLNGRTIHPGDSAAVSDLAANPGDYDEIQDGALFAEKLKLDPGACIDGPIRVGEKLRFYPDSEQTRPVRNEFLESIGNRFVTSQAKGQELEIRHPHPLAGEVTFFRSPSSSVERDLERLGLGDSWTEARPRPVYPKIDYSRWRTYRLYEGGFEYAAVKVGWRLQKKTLRPSPDNPLGIFFRDGSVQLDDDVTIQGTLVAKGRVRFRGRRIHVAGFNWRGDGGKPIVSDAEHWPRLPAIVAQKVSMDRDVQASVHGAIVVDLSVKNTEADFELIGPDAVGITGTATSRPVRQPWSIVQLQGQPNLSPLGDRGHYAVWLEDPPTGGWYRIVAVDQKNHQLRVVGEVRHDSPTGFRIRQDRRRSVDIHGPVSGKEHEIHGPPVWNQLSESQWNDLHNTWENENKDRADAGLAPIEFVDWLARPDNFSGWSGSIRRYGLNLAHVTFHLRNTEAIHTRFSPPLFAPYGGAAADAEFAGYRWEIVSWRETP